MITKNDQGVAYLQLAKLTLARSDFDRAIALNSQHAFAYKNRGLLEMRKLNYEKALSDLHKAANLFEETGDRNNYDLVKQMIQLASSLAKPPAIAKDSNLNLANTASD